MRSDIWIPDIPADQVTIYIDETNFDGESGLIQVGIPIPDAGDREFKKAVSELLDRFPRFQHKEFKAGKINEANAAVYREFIRYVINLLGLVNDGCDLRAVVTVEAAARSADQERELILNTVNSAFDQFKVDTAVAPEFARQVGWLRRNFDYLCTAPIQNSFRVLSDAKFRDAEECQELKSIVSPTLGIPILWEHAGQLTAMLNAILGNTRKKNGLWMPEFTQFRFEKSENSLYIQAADLLANLFYNGLKFEKGIRNEKTILKNDILCSVHDRPFEPRLLDSLEVVPRVDKQGEVHEQLFLNNSAFSGRMTLLPYRPIKG